ncbi:MAG: SUF system NifU family Fe-S cluster assembly protein [Gammaproteobacteria bacterium]|nr:SUF system NifU family Fe-S cluster assembly protein [Gammaproteobacteria bacterium]
MTDLRALYEEVILDHNRRPRNFKKKPQGTNRHALGYNPLCGDQLQLDLRVQDGVIQDVGFEGTGCAISTASASLMTESIKGKTVEQAETLFRDMLDLLTQHGEPTEIGKLRVLAGVREYPARVKCATLPWHTLRAALDNAVDAVSTE